MHDGDHRARKLVQPAHRIGGRVGRRIGRRRIRDGCAPEPGDIGAGLEMPPGAADHHRAHRRIGTECRQPRDQAEQHGVVIGIAHRRAIEGDGGNAARVDGDQDGRLAHASLRMLSAPRC